MATFVRRAAEQKTLFIIIYKTVSRENQIIFGQEPQAVLLVVSSSAKLRSELAGRLGPPGPRHMAPVEAEIDLGLTLDGARLTRPPGQNR